MPSSILSQGEINALLQAGAAQGQARSENFLDVLQDAFLGALTQLRGLSSQAVEGPYVERLEHGLAQVIAPVGFVAAAELERCELLLVLPEPDGEKLAQETGVDSLEVLGLLGQAWVSQLAEAWNVPYTVYQGHRVDLGALNPPSGGKPHLVRYFIQVGPDRLEFCVVLQDLQNLQTLAARAEQNPGGGQQGRTRSKSHLMKGDLGVSRAVFTPIGDLGQVEDKQGLNLLQDIELTITVELGRTTLTLSEILELKAQSVIKLERLAGEPVDVFVNNSKVARGEVVVLDENFGVRILEIVPKSQRNRE